MQRLTGAGRKRAAPARQRPPQFPLRPHSFWRGTGCSGLPRCCL